MGARGPAALVVLLLASALLANPASGSARRVLEVEKPSSGEAPPPTVPAGGSPKGGSESGQSSPVGQKADNHVNEKSPPPALSPSKDTKEPSSEKRKEGGEAQASASPPPPPPVKETNSQTTSPPPGGLGPNGGGEAKSGTDQEGTGSESKETDKMKEVMEECDTSNKCSTGTEFSACLQVSENASVGSFIIVQNKGQNEIIVNIKEPSNIDMDKKPLHLPRGAFRQMNITYIRGNITLSDGHGDCVIHVMQSVERQSVSDWQQPFQTFAAYATRLNPIYGASFFVFTVVLVGIVCACCKFARRGTDGVPYQQLEMGAQAPNSAVVDNTTSTTDGWEGGWDDDWDDEEAHAKPSDKIPTSSVSANGLSLRSQTNSKDGWDVDWDD